MQPVDELSDATFDEQVLRSERPVLVDVWAPWCRPCETVMTILEDLDANARGRVLFARLNADGNPESPGRHEVLALPTVLAFVDGKEVGRVVGARHRSEYERLLAEVLPADDVEGLAAEDKLDA